MKKYLAIAAVAMMFAACTNDDMPEVPAVDRLTDTPITVNAGVADLVTRAGMTTADLVDLGLFIENTTNSKYSYSNIQFEKDATGKFVLAGSTTPLWQNGTQRITVRAYSPYHAAWTELGAQYGIEVKTDQSTEANLKASDLLYEWGEVDPAASYQTGDIRYHNGALDITLKHLCSKLTVNVRFGSELTDISDVPAKGLTLNNLHTKGNIILYDGSIGPKLENDAADIIAYKMRSAPDGYNSSFEAILIPQEASFTVKIELDGGRTFRWEHAGNFRFTPSRNYTLNLVVGKDKVKVAAEGFTVSNWEDSTGDSLVTE